MKKYALGRGLDALLPEETWQSQVREIPIQEIDLNPDQPRKDYDREALQQLADSMKEMGVLQPILVKQEKGRYRIIAGERRFRAARLAGLHSLPCIEKDFSLEETMLAALIENLQREDLNPMDEAAAIRAIMDRLNLTQEQAAQRLGKSRPALANTLRLLSLPDEVADMVRLGQLSEGHARVLAGLRDSDRQLALARRCVSEGLSVRALEALSAESRPRSKPTRPKAQVPELYDFAERLHRATGVRAQITGDLHKGRLIFSYRSYQELEALYEALGQVLE